MILQFWKFHIQIWEKVALLPGMIEVFSLVITPTKEEFDKLMSDPNDKTKTRSDKRPTAKEPANKRDKTGRFKPGNPGNNAS